MGDNNGGGFGAGSGNIFGGGSWVGLRGDDGLVNGDSNPQAEIGDGDYYGTRSGEGCGGGLSPEQDEALYEQDPRPLPGAGDWD